MIPILTDINEAREILDARCLGATIHWDEVEMEGFVMLRLVPPAWLM